MNYSILTYCLYLLISIAATVWVAKVLFKNGRIFLIDIFQGNSELADSVNRLLVVGFYFLNIGYISLTLTETVNMDNARVLLEVLSRKVGLIVFVLGIMHFLNLIIFFKLRARAQHAKVLRDHYQPLS
jgi:hypothetical protein